MKSLTERILRRKIEYEIMTANHTESTKSQEEKQNNLEKSMKDI